MINICVPVLRRYDMLKGMIESLELSTVPFSLHVIDNGRNSVLLHDALNGHMADILVPDAPMGVAECWNWFLDNVPEERIITNDDILFAPDSLERIVASPYDIAWTEEAGFSCFLIRDRCVQKVGFFDEALSPGYAYFEDCDYAMRLNGRGTKPPVVPSGHVTSGVIHLHSKTLEAATEKELKDHHRRFTVAQMNYRAKWGVTEP